MSLNMSLIHALLCERASLCAIVYFSIASKKTEDRYSQEQVILALCQILKGIE
jgi:hypothetical protein